ncbi:hypothetical protein BJ741DRAFT_710965 [Chytriomyces cf. hyalinus JEL632]|nr:hypothetical protein BJ741DRAFT_710965 [Chytriomyces cf. hyalinus JEL632]
MRVYRSRSSLSRQKHPKKTLPHTRPKMDQSITATIKDKIKFLKSNKEAEKMVKYALLEGGVITAKDSTAVAAKERKVQADFIPGMNVISESSLGSEIDENDAQFYSTLHIAMDKYG